MLTLTFFQTITSFANKALLGGQSLENLKSHPFAQFQKELVDFTNFMEKLQLKIEDSRWRDSKKLFNGFKIRDFLRISHFSDCYLDPHLWASQF